MSTINYYASQTNYDSGLVSERDEYAFDTYGRRSGFVRYTVTTNFTLPLAGGSDSQGRGGPNFRAADHPDDFAPTRTEATLYDNRGRVLHEISPEGTLSYDYDSAGRMTYTAINADLSNITLPLVGASSISDARALTISELGESERVTAYGYDILGRLVSVTEDATPGIDTDEPQTDTSYGFDLQGRQRVVETLQGSNTTPLPSILSVMQYDSLGRLDTMQDFTLPPGNAVADFVPAKTGVFLRGR